MILIIDNYDSFTYNVYQYVGQFNPKVEVIKNDEISISQIKEKSIDKIIISPGPGHPKDSKVSLDCINQLGDDIPILGICLGHQAIGIAFGAEIINSNGRLNQPATDNLYPLRIYNMCRLVDYRTDGPGQG